MADRFLLIAQPGSYRIAPYIQAAKQLGLEILIASRGEHSLITEVHAGLHIDLDDTDTALAAILTAHKEKPFVGVLGSDDSTVELAALAAEKLSLPHNPVEAARYSHRKDLARKHLKLAGCPVPMHRTIDLKQPLDKQLANLPYPCVIKPINMSASRGVIRANDDAQLKDAIERIKPLLMEAHDAFEQQHLLIEQYIDGIEIAYEGYLHNGALHQLVIFDKPDPMVGPFFEETIYVTPSRLAEDVQHRIHERIQQACTAYGLTTGPVHAELRIDAQDAWILEVASRTIGGDCARVLDGHLGFSIEALTIALACRRDIQHETPEGARGVMMIPVPKAGILRRIEGFSDARKIPHIDQVEIAIPEGHELVPLPEGNQYPGYIFASADRPETVVSALKQAHACLKFVVAPLWKLSQGPTE